MEKTKQTLVGRSDSPTIEELAEASKPFKCPRMETITTTAALYGLPVHFVRAAVAKGDVVSVRAGRKILVNCDSLTTFLNTGIPQGAAANAPESTRRSDEKSAARVAPISLR